MKGKEITVVKVEPLKSPCIVKIRNDLDSLQKAVSIGAEEQGLIEFVYLEDNVSLMLNEEGKLIGLPANRRLGNDILCGVFYIVGESKSGNLISLTPAQQKKYSQMFERVEYIDKSEVQTKIYFDFFGV